jgi:hypothetical protein
MSYDLQVWSVYPVARAALKDGIRWSETPSGWVRGARGWQIVVNRSDHVLAEDIPDEVVAMLPGIQYLTQIQLEGRWVETSLKLVLSTTDALARSCHGVLIDPQQGTRWAPSGVKRISLAERKERFSTLTFSWWFLDGPLLARPGRERLLGILARELPDALPKRYGLYEPPQYLYAETGQAHLLDFLDQHLTTGLGLVIWYPRWPVVSFNLHLPKSAGGGPRGFRSNYIQIEVDREVVTQAGWENQLRRFWVELEPFNSPLLR